MDGRAFYESVKSFCQCRGGPHVNVQQLRGLSARRAAAAAAVAAVAVAAAASAATVAAAAAPAVAVAQDRFTQAAGQSTVWRFEQALQRAEETVVRVETDQERWPKVAGRGREGTPVLPIQLLHGSDVHDASVRVPHATRPGQVRVGVPLLGRHDHGPIAVAQGGPDRQTVDGHVPDRRGQAAARCVADGLDRDRQAAAGVVDRQADPAQGAVAAGMLVERHQRAAQRQRGAAGAHLARPQLRDRHERLVSARRPVLVERQHPPRPIPQPTHSEAGWRGHRRRVAAVRGPVRAKPGRVRPVTELPDH